MYPHTCISLCHTCLFKAKEGAEAEIDYLFRPHRLTEQEAERELREKHKNPNLTVVNVRRKFLPIYRAYKSRDLEAA